MLEGLHHRINGLQALVAERCYALPIAEWETAVTFPQVPSLSAGLASEAAQYLRKTHRPVYHRIIEGKEFRGQYVVGAQLLSAQELIALAKEKGFDACNRLLDDVDR